MLKLAVTGNIASGKSLIEILLIEQGIKTIDTDKVVHELLSRDKNIIKKVSNLFDTDVKNNDGGIDRKKVGNIVFGDKNKLSRLEAILHPEVKKNVEKFFSENKNEKIIAVSVPQLYESGWEVLFDYVLIVIADDKIRLERLIKRNNLSLEDAEKRLSVQIPQEEKVKKADFLIDNSGSPENTELLLKKVLEILQNLSMRSKNEN